MRLINYEQFEQPLVDAGWEVIVFVPSEEEDKDRITCGNSLLDCLNAAIAKDMICYELH